MSDKISERIKKGLKIRNMKQSELVEKTGIGKSSISTYLSGDYEPKQRNIYKIAKALNVDEAWLMGLDVPMEKVHYIQALELIKNEEFISTNKLSKEETTLLENYNKLNDLGKDRLIEYSNDLIETPKYIDTKESNVTELIPTTKEKDEHIGMAAHNDFADDDEQQKLMKEDLDEL